jgi:hypothetical protein
MTHTIDKNIPIPERNPNRGGPGKARQPSNNYPFANMYIGDSILVTNRTQIQAASAAHNWARYQLEPHAKFTARDVPDGVRIWRTA